jgi:hypothetical protein
LLPPLILIDSLHLRRLPPFRLIDDADFRFIFAVYFHYAAS